MSIEACASKRCWWPQPSVWVIGAGVVVAMHIGKVAVAIPILRQSLGISLVQAGTLLSMSQMAGMALAVLVGLFADAWGLRRSLVCGLVLMGLSSVMGAWANGIGVLLGLRVIEGMAFLLVVVSAPALLRQLVPPQRLALTMGLWGSFMPAGTASALLLGPWVLESYGWPVWWAALGGVSLLMALACARVLWPLEAAGGVRAARWRDHGDRLWQTWCNPGTWWVALTFGLYSSQWLVVIGFFPTLLQAAGLGAAAAGSVTALVSVANIGGNVLAGRLLHHGWRVHRVLAVGFAVMATSAVLIFDGLGAWPPLARIAAAILFSGLGGMIPGALFTLAVRVAPSEQTVSTSLGWTTQMSMVGQFVMPPSAAALAQAVGGWHWTWLLNCSAAALAFVLIARLRLLLMR